MKEKDLSMKVSLILYQKNQSNNTHRQACVRQRALKRNLMLMHQVSNMGFYPASPQRAQGRAQSKKGSKLYLGVEFRTFHFYKKR